MKTVFYLLSYLELLNSLRSALFDPYKFCEDTQIKAIADKELPAMEMQHLLEIRQTIKDLAL
jgi:hypothetical protein